MKQISIAKKGGKGVRVIMCPTPVEASILRRQLDYLNATTTKLCSTNVHGFVRGRNVVSNAQSHIGYRYTASFDLSDFFDSVTKDHVQGRINADALTVTMPQGKAWQGLPTSPALANIAACPMDTAIERLVSKYEMRYTRYADDLTFSFNDYALYAILKDQIPQIAARCKFKINKDKTRLQDAAFGQRIITGVSVGEMDVCATRETRRKLRAAKHKGNYLSARGLEEWSKVKLPREPTVWDMNQHLFESLIRTFKLPMLSYRKLAGKQHLVVSENVVITGDLAYTLGPSSFTTGWRSCLTHPSGNGRRVGKWCYLEGMRIGALMSKETMVIGGVTRRKMRARANVYSTTCGRLVADRVYGESASAIQELQSELYAVDVVSSNYDGDALIVKGSITGMTPYTDLAAFCKLKDGITKVCKIRTKKMAGTK